MVSAYTQAVVAGGMGKTGKSNAAQKMQRRIKDERKNEARQVQAAAQQEAAAAALSTKAASSLTPAEQEFVAKQETEWAAKRRAIVNADLAKRDAKVKPFDLGGLGVVEVAPVVALPVSRSPARPRPQPLLD